MCLSVFERMFSIGTVYGVFSLILKTHKQEYSKPTLVVLEISGKPV